VSVLFREIGHQFVGKPYCRSTLDGEFFKCPEDELEHKQNKQCSESGQNVIHHELWFLK
jgi:hypothetical protein